MGEVLFFSLKYIYILVYFFGLLHYNGIYSEAANFDEKKKKKMMQIVCTTRRATLPSIVPVE